MRRVTVTERQSKQRRAVRAGRPPRELAGEVDARILDAAQRLFLERGLAGTSVDEIASLARAGKPSIYCRFPSKETLFTAVVMRGLLASIERFESDAPTGVSVEDRLESVGATVLKWVLVGETIGLARLAIAEARRLPALASRVNRMARASSSISSSCPCSCGRCSERSSRSCTRRSGRTWRAALLSLLRRAGMTASLDLTDSLCGLGNSVAGLRILRLSARDPFATPTIKVHEQYEILPKRFPRLAN